MSSVCTSQQGRHLCTPSATGPAVEIVVFVGGWVEGRGGLSEEVEELCRNLSSNRPRTRLRKHTPRLSALSAGEYLGRIRRVQHGLFLITTQ